MAELDIYVDLDGVLADYDAEYFHLFRVRASDETSKQRRIRFRNHPDFFQTLKPMPDAITLWNFLKPFHPHILSASSNFVPLSKQHKLEWVDRYLNMTGPKVIIVDHPEKKKAICHPGAILIDDSPKNCEQWNQAGGTAIHHVSAAKTIAQLKTLIQSEGVKFEQFIQYLNR